MAPVLVAVVDDELRPLVEGEGGALVDVETGAEVDPSAVLVRALVGRPPAVRRRLSA